MATSWADGDLVHWFDMTSKGVLKLELWACGHHEHNTVLYYFEGKTRS